MSDSKQMNGKCLCGAVSVTATPEAHEVGACHCSMCRNWGGGPFMEIDCGSTASFSGEDNISVFSSSDWAERGFCSSCGTHLFYRLKETGQTMVPVGLFEDQDSLKFTGQVFIDEKPPFYAFANKTQDFTGAEIFAMFGKSD